MKSACGQFLSRSVFARNEYGHGALRSPFQEDANIINPRAGSQNAPGGEAILNNFAESLVLFDQFLLTSLHFDHGLGVLQSHGCMKRERLDELFLELSVPVVHDDRRLRFPAAGPVDECLSLL